MYNYKAVDTYKNEPGYSNKDLLKKSLNLSSKKKSYKYCKNIKRKICY